MYKLIRIVKGEPIFIGSYPTLQKATDVAENLSASGEEWSDDPWLVIEPNGNILTMDGGCWTDLEDK